MRADNTDIPALLARLHERLDALGDPGDVPLTLNAQAAFAAQQSALRGLIRNIESSAATLREVEPRIAELQHWQADLESWRAALGEELLALPNRDPRAWNLTRSIQVIDRGLGVLTDSGYMLETTRLGALMRQSGYTESVPPPLGEARMRLPWLGALPEVERHLRDLTTRRDGARAILERVTEPMEPPHAGSSGRVA